jgi:hypothetical protein
MGHWSSEKWENCADTNVCEPHDRAHIIFCRCERQKNKKGNVKFLIENLEEIWDFQVHSCESCLCDTAVGDNTKKVKSYLAMPWRHLVAVAVPLCWFGTWGEWSASSPGHWNSRKEPHYPLNSRLGPHVMENTWICCPCWGLNPVSFSLLPTHYSDYSVLPSNANTVSNCK